MPCTIINQRELSIMLLVGESPKKGLPSVVTIFMKNAYLEEFLETFQNWKLLLDLEHAETLVITLLYH
jgi:hypothetical protein